MDGLNRERKKCKGWRVHSAIPLSRRRISLVKLFLQSFAVLLIAAVVAVASWGLRAKSLVGQIHYGVPTLTCAKAEQLEQAGKTVLWVNVQAADDPERRGHVLRLDSWESDLGHLLETWAPDDIVVVTGDPKSREATRKAAERLDRAGLPSVYLLAWGDTR